MKDENKLLVEEIESISSSFEEAEAQSQRLLETVTLKEGAATRLMGERLRAGLRAPSHKPGKLSAEECRRRGS